MTNEIKSIRDEARTKLSSANDLQSLEQLRVHFMGKKGLITGLMAQLRDLTPEKKKELGATLNQIKEDFEKEFSRRSQELSRADLDKELAQAPALDVTLPGTYIATPGSLHPVSTVLQDIIRIMRRIGFSVATGPEIETEFYNFEALNTPESHPARDVQDTFYIDPPILLRSHTSPVQIRTMQKMKPPLQIIAPGRVYRSDYDLTHTPMFHQVEGLMVDTDISLADLKGTLHYLVKSLFGERDLRFRPSYFPFTEPSAEVDMQCIQCKGNGAECRTCKSSGWLEIGGCGMVHPNVFQAVGYDTSTYSGFAFGMGIERIAMLRYGIDDLRSLFENDERMLEQF